jgi:hypothetical protein
VALDRILEGLDESKRAEALRIFEKLESAFAEERMRLAALLASKGDHELFGKTEYEIRDGVHRLGAKSLEAALEERQKKGLRRS